MTALPLAEPERAMNGAAAPSYVRSERTRVARRGAFSYRPAAARAATAE